MTGTYLVTRAVARVMIEQQSGRIINVASVLGVVPARLQCAFVAAKAGVVQLTRATAIELAEYGILVNCVAPGLIDTGIVSEEVFEQAKEMIPLRRMGQVNEVSGLVSFLMSEKASYITRQVVSVNGGMI